MRPFSWIVLALALLASSPLWASGKKGGFTPPKLPFTAAQVCLTPDQCVPAVKVSGSIPPSPYYVSDFDAFIAIEMPDQHPRLVTFDSTGGSLRPALLLARHLREQGFDTIVEPGAKCSSACVYAFAGGVHRTIAPGARIGIHSYEAQPRSPEDTAEFAQVAVREIGVALRDLGVRSDLLLAILTTPNDKVCYVRRACAHALNLDTQSPLAAPTPGQCDAGPATWLAPDHNEAPAPPALCEAIDAQGQPIDADSK